MSGAVTPINSLGSIWRAVASVAALIAVTYGAKSQFAQAVARREKRIADLVAALGGMAQWHGEPALPRGRRQRLTADQHAAIGETLWQANEQARRAIGRHGKGHPRTKLAWRLENQLCRLRSDLDDQAFAELSACAAIRLYFGLGQAAA